MILQGAFTATVTPFAHGKVDEDRLARNVAFQIEQGIDGLVPVGTTGESPTLSHDEHRLVVEKTIEAVRNHRGTAGETPAPPIGGVKVIAGAGSNSTSEALALTRHAKEAGADAALLVSPYYNKPTQEGLYRHFMTIADAVDIPIVLYNIPGRTAVTIAPGTVVRLAEHPNIVAVKEATGSLDIASEIYASTDTSTFSILSGDDSLTLPLMSIGGRGVVSVVSNLLPARVKALTDAGMAGDFETARRLHAEFFPLFKGCLTLATNPIPIKTAMALAGMDTGELRLPLCEMDESDREKLKALQGRYGVK